MSIPRGGSGLRKEGETPRLQVEWQEKLSLCAPNADIRPVASENIKLGLKSA